MINALAAPGQVDVVETCFKRGHSRYRGVVEPDVDLGADQVQERVTRFFLESAALESLSPASERFGILRKRGVDYKWALKRVCCV